MGGRDMVDVAEVLVEVTGQLSLMLEVQDAQSRGVMGVG
jgi:hypothetical protein